MSLTLEMNPATPAEETALASGEITILLDSNSETAIADRAYYDLEDQEDPRLDFAIEYGNAAPKLVMSRTAARHFMHTASQLVGWSIDVERSIKHNDPNYTEHASVIATRRDREKLDGFMGVLAKALFK